MSDLNQLNVHEQIGYAAPSVAVTGLTLLGHPIADWLVVATLTYTLVQLFIFVDIQLPLWRARHGCIKK